MNTKDKLKGHISVIRQTVEAVLFEHMSLSEIEEAIKKIHIHSVKLDKIANTALGRKEL